MPRTSRRSPTAWPLLASKSCAADDDGVPSGSNNLPRVTEGLAESSIEVAGELFRFSRDLRGYILRLEMRIPQLSGG